MELIAALQTSQSTLERAKAFAVACGKGDIPATVFPCFLRLTAPPKPTEVTTSQDVPGFVSNAVLMPFINEVSVDPFTLCGMA